jgi:Fis family transcriptional regulator
MDTNTNNHLSINELISDKVNTYLSSFDASKITNLNDLFLSEVEPPLLEAVMKKCKYNQVRAAKILGISRGTLRKKLKKHFDNKYVGTRDPE